jgi:hypothetical protein
MAKAEIVGSEVPDDEHTRRRGPLYHVDAHDYRPLLDALLPLIAAGEWPREIVTDRKKEGRAA